MDNRGLGGLPMHLKGCNYIPRKCYVDAPSLAKMWLSFDGEEIEREIDLIEDLGVNIVRFFLPTQQFWSFDNERRAQMDFVLGALEARSMMAVPTLFTYAGLDWTKPENTFPYLERQILAYKDRAVIFGWDYFNEISHYFVNSKGDVNISQYPVRGKTKPYYQIFIDWAEKVYNKIKELDPVHPVFSGDFGWSVRLNRPDLQVMSDFISIHVYDRGELLDELVTKSLVMFPDKPIMLGELGYPTGGRHDDENHSLVPDSSAAEGCFESWKPVLDKYKTTVDLFPFIWTAFDFRIASSPDPQSVQNYFGLYDEQYNLKSIGKIFKKWQ